MCSSSQLPAHGVAAEPAAAGWMGPDDDDVMAQADYAASPEEWPSHHPLSKREVLVAAVATPERKVVAVASGGTQTDATQPAYQHSAESSRSMRDSRRLQTAQQKMKALERQNRALNMQIAEERKASRVEVFSPAFFMYLGCGTIERQSGLCS